MNLKNIKTIMTAYKDKDLLRCNLCHNDAPYYIAVDDNWVKDTDKNVFYCPDCEKILIDKLDNINE